MTAQITAGQLRDFSTLRAAGLSALAAADVLETARETGAIELASTAYLTEHRGKGGQWTRGAGIPGSQSPAPAPNTAALKGIRAASSRQATGQQTLKGMTPANVPQTPEEKHDLEAHNRHATVQAVAIATSRIETDKKLKKITSDQAAEMTQLVRQVRRANQRIAALEESKEADRAKWKLAVEAGTAVAGAVLAGIMAKMGIDGTAVIGAALGPTFIMQIIEWAKRL
jgi:hypothetical protein